MSMSRQDAVQCLDLGINGQVSFGRGSVVGMTEDGQPLVDHPGNTTGPIPARTIVPRLELRQTAGELRTPVLLAFEDGDPLRPIILGVVRRTLEAVVPETGADERARLADPVAFVDGERVVLEAREEIVLVCGKSTITLRKDGKIVIRGTHVVSRARCTNAIRGGAVKIN